MTTRTVLSLAFLFALSSPGLAAKKMYKWVDAQGNVTYSERQPPEASKLGSSTLSASGVVVETKPSQDKAREVAAAAARTAAEKKALLEQDKADQRLLDSYASEDDLLRGYEQNVELIEQQVIATRVDITSRQKSLDALVARAGENERTGKPVADQLKTMISTERTQIETQRAYLAKKETDKALARKQYEANLARYRAVLNKQSGKK